MYVIDEEAGKSSSPADLAMGTTDVSDSESSKICLILLG